MKKNKELKHLKAIRQIGPTCGYYALINGMHHVTPETVTKCMADELVESLLSIGKKHLPHTVGEQFDNETFRTVIAEWHHPEIKTIQLMKLSETLDNLVYEPNTFYLLPIYRAVKSRKKKFAHNSHWLCLVPQPDGTLIVLDSNNRSKKRFKTKTDIREANKELASVSFDWADWLDSQPRTGKLRYGGLLDRITHPTITKTLDALYVDAKKRPIGQQPLNKQETIKITLCKKNRKE